MKQLLLLGGTLISLFLPGTIIHSVMLTRLVDWAWTKVQQQQGSDSRLKQRQSLTSGKMTHHISFTLSILGDAATFFVFSSSEAKDTAKPFFFFSNLPSVLQRKLRWECCVSYHRRETDAQIRQGSKCTHSVSNQSLQRVLREKSLLFW